MTPPLVDDALGDGAGGPRATLYPIALVEERPGLWVAINLLATVILQPYRLRCFRPRPDAVFVQAELGSRPLYLVPTPVAPDLTLACELPCSLFDIEQSDPNYSLGLLPEPLERWHPGERLTLDVRGDVERIVILAKKEFP